MTMSNKMSVIVPSYRRPRDLERCLAALAAQSRPPDEILIVLRETDSTTQRLVASSQGGLRSLIAVPVVEPGLIQAMNCGLATAKGDFVVFTDDDSEPEADWLNRIEHSFEDERIGAVGGRDWLQLPDEPALFAPAEATKVGVLSWYGKQHGNHHCPLRGHACTVMFLKGVNMAYRTRALENYRVDIRLRGTGAQVGSELDLCMHVRRSGFKVLFDDRILVKHYSSARPGGEDRTDVDGQIWKDTCYNTHYLVAKHFGRAQAWSHFCYRTLFGTRALPGLLASLRWTLKGDLQIWRRMRQMTKVALEGHCDGRSARTRPPASTNNLELAQERL
jgi:glycosyltransferase involved in cell wall biosynthesis